MIYYSLFVILFLLPRLLSLDSGKNVPRIYLLSYYTISETKKNIKNEKDEAVQKKKVNG